MRRTARQPCVRLRDGSSATSFRNQRMKPTRPAMRDEQPVPRMVLWSRLRARLHPIMIFVLAFLSIEFRLSSPHRSFANTASCEIRGCSPAARRKYRTLGEIIIAMAG